MSLKAKLEAVIYASEEPVTLAQLAVLFAAEALEWKAAQAAAAAEQTAEILSGELQLPLTDPELPEGEVLSLGLPETAAPAETSVDQADGVAAASEQVPEPAEAQPVVESPVESADAEPVQEVPVDTEAETRRLSRLRDRDVKAVLKQLLDELIAGYATEGRGVEIREIAGGYRMATKPECHDAVRMFVKSLKPAMKLSLPALETLAVVAYKQPVTAPEVNEIRGVESAGVLGSLLARKLIATAGRKQVIGRPILYKTTKEFLLRFGLKDVAELPSMEEFEKIAAIELAEPEGAIDEAAEPAESGPAFDEDAELEGNSPSGQEMAESNHATEGATAETADAAADEQKTQESLASPTAEMAAEPQSEMTESTPTEAAPAEPDPTLQAETEEVPHGEENQEDR